MPVALIYSPNAAVKWQQALSSHQIETMVYSPLTAKGLSLSFQSNTPAITVWLSQNAAHYASELQAIDTEHYAVGPATKNSLHVNCHVSPSPYNTRSLAEFIVSQHTQNSIKHIRIIGPKGADIDIFRRHFKDSDIEYIAAYDLHPTKENIVLKDGEHILIGSLKQLKALLGHNPHILTNISQLNFWCHTTAVRDYLISQGSKKIEIIHDHKVDCTIDSIKKALLQQ